MKLNSISFTNFLSYGSETVDLSGVHLASIVGENGAGKSSMFEGILYALYGISRADTDAELIRSGEKEMSVLLKFEIGGNEVEVMRSIEQGATKLTLSVNGEARTKSIIKETQQAIVNLLKMNSTIFTSSAFIQQGKFDEFIRKTSAEKKRILMDALDLDRFTKYEEKVKVTLKQLQDDSKFKNMKLSETVISCNEIDLAELLKQSNDAVVFLNVKSDEQTQLESKLGQLEMKYDQVKKQQATYLENKRRMQTLENTAENLKKDKLTYENDTDNITFKLKGREFVEQEKSLTEEQVRKQTSELERDCRTSEINCAGVLNDIKYLQKETKELQETSNICPTCGQTLPKESIEKIQEKISKKSEELTELSIDLNARQDSIKLLKVRIEDSKLLEEWLRMQNNLKKWNQIEEHLKVLREEYKQLKAAVSQVDMNEDDLLGLPKMIQEMKQNIKNGQEEINQANILLGTLNEQRKRKEQLTKDLQKLKVEIQELQEKIVVQDELQLAFSKKGIPSLIIDDSLPMLQEESNRLLDKFGGELKVEFKKKDDKADSLELHVEDSFGKREVSMFSGGEVVRISLATRVALSKLLMNRAQSKIELLVIDEPAFLDDAGINQLVECLSSLSDEFKQIMVVSHLKELTEVFPTTIYVEKKEQGSSVRIV